MAPASLMRLTRNASLFETKPFSDSDPAALCRPIVSKLSLTIAGMQWSGPTGPDCAKRAIELVGLLLRVGIDDDDGVQRRTVLVVGVDAPQVGVDERAAGEPSGLHRRVDLRRWSSLRREMGRRCGPAAAVCASTAVVAAIGSRSRWRIMSSELRRMLRMIAIVISVNRQSSVANQHRSKPPSPATGATPRSVRCSAKRWTRSSTAATRSSCCRPAAASRSASRRRRWSRRRGARRSSSRR